MSEPTRPPNTGIKLDYQLGITLARAHIVRYVLVGSLAFATALVWLSFIAPTSYLGSLSVSIQGPSMPVGGLGLLSGIVPNQLKYMGILKSRHLAESVSKTVSLSERLSISPDEAVLMLMKGIRPDETTGDGLVYIKLNLEGPPPLAADPKGLRKTLGGVVADATNAYANALIAYFDTSDNDRDSVLRRNADDLEQIARKTYAESFNHLNAFVLRTPVGRNVTSIPPDAGGPKAAAPQIQALLTALFDLSGEIERLKKRGTTLKNLVAGQIAHPNDLPVDDALLRGQRTIVNDERKRLAEMRIQFADTHPDVVTQMERVRLAERELRKQIEAVRQGKTTEHVLEESELRGLMAKAEVLRSKLGQTMEGLQIGRKRELEFQSLQARLELSFEAWKTAAQQAIIIRSQTTASHSKVAVIDSALEVPGTPSKLRVVLISLLVAIGAAILTFGTEYTIRNEARFN